MAKITKLINLKPGVDFPEDGTDAYEFIKALETAAVEKLNELDTATTAMVTKLNALENRVKTLEETTVTATEFNALENRVKALES